MRASTLRAVASLERAADAQLRAAHGELLSLQAERRRLLEHSGAARRELCAQTTWSAFACSVLANHLAKCAVLSGQNLVRQRATLARGARIARLKRRWATVRIGLARRAARVQDPLRWRD